MRTMVKVPEGCRRQVSPQLSDNTDKNKGAGSKTGAHHDAQKFKRKTAMQQKTNNTYGTHKTTTV